MAYYLLNKTGTTNITSATLYELKRVNTIVDKPSGSGKDIRMGSQGSNTSGSHLGPGLNPWQGQKVGIGGTQDDAGLMGFNSPSNTSAQSSLSYLREYDWKYNPNTWGGDSYNAFYSNDGPEVNLFPEVRNPGWNQGKYANIWFYSIDTPADGMSLSKFNFITGQQTNESSTNKIRLATGVITTSGGSVSTVAGGASASFNGSNFSFAPANIGQGEGTPYNESSELGSSTVVINHYRNNSNQNKARVVTLNTNYTTSPTISIGAEQSPTNRGNPVFSHGAINMGKGTVWAGFHRGANYQRVQYANWNTGTTFSTISDLLVSSRSSSNTLHHGWMVKLTDELALWFYPRRSGNTSGSSRLIAVTALETSGASKIPSVRGSTELATHDIGSISTQACSAAVGSSDTAGTVYGIVAWSETTAGNDALNIMSWKYVVSTNTMTFETGKIHTTDTSYTNTNTYRMHVSIKCLGFHSDENKNYYELVIPQGIPTGGGATLLTIEQSATATGGGSITETGVLDPGNTNLPTDAITFGQHSFLNYPTGRQWFLNSVPGDYIGKTWSLYCYRKTDGTFRAKALGWTLNTP